jgi:hypothetical protein
LENRSHRVKLSAPSGGSLIEATRLVRMARNDPRAHEPTSPRAHEPTSDAIRP